MPFCPPPLNKAAPRRLRALGALLALAACLLLALLHGAQAATLPGHAAEAAQLTPTPSAPCPDPSQLTLLGMAPLTQQRVMPVVVAGTVGYVGEGDQLTVLVVVGSTRFASLGRVALPGPVTALALADQRLYVAADDLYIFSLDDPTAPRQIGVFDAPAPIVDIAVQGRYAYLTDGALHVVDISDAAHPQLVGALATADYFLDLKVAGTRAYIGAYATPTRDRPSPGRLLAVDIATPAAPAEVGVVGPLPPLWLDAPIKTWRFEVAANRAYVARGAEGLAVYDLTDPNPTEVVGFHPANLSLWRVAVAGQRVYVSGDYPDPAHWQTTGDPPQPLSARLYILDATDPTALDPVGSLPTRPTTSLHVNGEDVYLAEQGPNSGNPARLLMIDVHTPNQPEVVEVYGPGYVGRWEIVVENGLAYVGQSASRLVYPIDMSDPLHPRYYPPLNLPFPARLVAVRNQTLYVLTGEARWGSALWIFDVSNPAAPRRLSVIPGVTDAAALVGLTLYAVREYEHAPTQPGLRIFDVSAPADPVLLGSSQPSTGSDIAVSEVAVVDTWVYIVDRDQLRIVDASNRAQPRERGILMIGGGWGRGRLLAATEQYVYVSSGADFAVLDVRSPAAPRLITRLQVTHENGAGDGCALYLSGPNVVDITTPDAPRLAPPPLLAVSGASGVALEGDRVYYAAPWLAVYRRSPAAPVAPSTTPAPSLTATPTATPTATSAPAVETPHPTAQPTASQRLYLPALVNRSKLPLQVQLNQVSSLGGYIDQVTVQDGRAYVARGDSLHIYDLTTPLAPRLLSRTPVTGTVSQLSLAGATLWVVQGDQLVAYDVTDPAAPRRLGQVSLVGGELIIYGTLAYTRQGDQLVAYDLAALGEVGRLSGVSGRLTFQDGYFYAWEAASLRIYAAANPEAMRQVGEITIPPLPQYPTITASNIVVAGRYVFLNRAAQQCNPYRYDPCFTISCWDDWLAVDIANPAQPGPIHRMLFGGTTTSPWSPCPSIEFRGVAPREQVLYANDGVYDVSDPANVRRVATLPARGEVAFADRTLYLTTGNELFILDNTNPTAPTTVAHLNMPGRFVAADHGYAYLADGSGLRAVDLAHPTQWRTVLDTFPFSPPTTIAARGTGNRIIYLGAANGVGAVDVSDHRRPQVVGGYPASAQHGLEDLGRYVLALGDGLTVLDVQNPAAPRAVVTYDVSTRLLAADERNLYLLLSDGLHLFDRTALPALHEQGWLPLTSQSNDFKAMVAYAGRVYLADQASLVIVDATTPGAPRLVGTLPLSNSPTDLVVDAGRLFVAGDGLRILDLADPTAPREVGVYGEGVQHVAVRGTRLYGASASGLHVLDISDPARPTRVGFYPVVLGDAQLAARGDTVFVVAGELWVFEAY